MTEILTQAGIADVTGALAAVMAFIGICAFLVSLITEGLKSFEKIDILPTKLVCYIVALVLTPLVFCGLMAYLGRSVAWYMVLAAFLASFVVAKVAMNGWDDVRELANRLIRQ
jgi:membrane associated rhomboid family serine protease